MRMNALSNYTAQLASCPSSGSGERRVHRWVLSMANRARRAGVGWEQWATDMSANATRPVPTVELREAWEKAMESGAGNTELPRRATEEQRRHKNPEEMERYRAGRKLFWWYVERGRGFDEAALRDKAAELGQPLEWTPGVEDAGAYLKTVFAPTDLLFCADEKFTAGVVGSSIRPRDEWIDELRRRAAAGRDLPCLVMPNPVSGRAESWKGGAPTTRGKGAVTTYRWVLLEHDKADLATQLEFWAGYCAVHGWECVGAMTHSAGKSIHVLWKVDAPNASAWEQNVVGKLIQPFKYMGGDDHGQNWAEMSRLPGAVRYPDPQHPEKLPHVPTIQKLLFLNREGFGSEC